MTGKAAILISGHKKQDKDDQISCNIFKAGNWQKIMIKHSCGLAWFLVRIIFFSDDFSNFICQKPAQPQARNWKKVPKTPRLHSGITGMKSLIHDQQ